VESHRTSLGRDAFGDLFGHIRSIYAKKKQKYILVKEFQEHVTEYNNPIALIDSVIKPYAEVWDFVRDADFEATEHAETINEHLFWLNRVDFKDWVPRHWCISSDSGKTKIARRILRITRTPYLFHVGHKGGYQRTHRNLRCAH
jgi:hypothetical protein